MTTPQAVDRGLEIRAQIAELEDQLSIIEEHLRQAALQGEQVELQDPDREGRQWIAHGTETTVPVVLTADLITQSFQDGSILHARLEGMANGKLPLLYRPVTTWKILPKTGKAFRIEAAALLGETAPAFISAATIRDKTGIPKSQIKVEWNRAEELP